jgi:hypothetical protein
MKFNTIIKRLFNCLCRIFKLPKERGRDAWGLSLIKIFLMLSVLIIIVFSFFSRKPGEAFNLIGLSLMVALAALLCGGLLGFLFGIPKSKASSQVADNNPNQPAAKFTDNTNLEDISDWLTKIIVGITLVELPQMEARFGTLCNRLKLAFSAYLGSNFAYTYASALVIFYFLCGFLAVYLWARTHLIFSLTSSALIEQTVKATVNKDIIPNFEKQQTLRALIVDFQQTALRIITAETSIKGIIVKAQPVAATVCGDCQKNRWGGKTEDSFFKIKATVTKSDELHMKANVRIGLLEVQSGKIVAIDKVFYMLHDSYLPEMIREVSNGGEQNDFPCSFLAYEAFTVGVVVVLNNGDVLKYEIDLNELKNLPADFGYDEKLKTIDEAKAELKELEEQIGE